MSGTLSDEELTKLRAMIDTFDKACERAESEIIRREQERRITGEGMKWALPDMYPGTDIEFWREALERSQANSLTFKHEFDENSYTILIRPSHGGHNLRIYFDRQNKRFAYFAVEPAHYVGLVDNPPTNFELWLTTLLKSGINPRSGHNTAGTSLRFQTADEKQWVRIEFDFEGKFVQASMVPT